MNQKGFSIILFLATLAFLLAGIVGGSLYIKEKYPELFLNQKDAKGVPVDFTGIMTEGGHSCLETKDGTECVVTVDNKYVWIREPNQPNNVRVHVIGLEYENEKGVKYIETFCNNCKFEILE